MKRIGFVFLAFAMSACTQKKADVQFSIDIGSQLKAALKTSNAGDSCDFPIDHATIQLSGDEFRRIEFTRSEILDVTTCATKPVQFEAPLGSQLMMQLFVAIKGTTTTATGAAFPYEAHLYAETLVDVNNSTVVASLQPRALLDGTDSNTDIILVNARHTKADGTRHTGKAFLRFMPNASLPGFDLREIDIIDGNLSVPFSTTDNFQVVSTDDGSVLIDSSELNPSTIGNQDNILVARIPDHFENNGGTAEAKSGAYLISALVGPGTPAGAKVYYPGFDLIPQNPNDDSLLFSDAALTNPMGWLANPTATQAAVNFHRISGGVSAANNSEMDSCRSTGQFVDKLCFYPATDEPFDSAMSGFRGPFGLVVDGEDRAFMMPSDTSPPIFNFSYTSGGSSVPAGLTGIEGFYTFIDQPEALLTTLYQIMNQYQDISCESLTSLGFASIGTTSTNSLAVPSIVASDPRQVLAIACPYVDSAGSRVYFNGSAAIFFDKDDDGGSSNYDGNYLAMPKKIYQDVCYKFNMYSHRQRYIGYGFPTDIPVEYYSTLADCQGSSNKLTQEDFDGNKFGVNLYAKATSSGSIDIKITDPGDGILGNADDWDFEVETIEVRSGTPPAPTQFILDVPSELHTDSCRPIALYLADGDGFAVPSTSATTALTLNADLVGSPHPSLSSDGCQSAGTGSLSLEPAHSSGDFRNAFAYIGGLVSTVANDIDLSLNSTFNHNATPFNPTASISTAERPYLKIEFESGLTENVSSQISWVTASSPGGCYPFHIAIVDAGGSSLTSPHSDDVRLELDDSSVPTKFQVHDNATCSNVISTTEHNRTTVEDIEMDGSGNRTVTLYLEIPGAMPPGFYNIWTFSSFPLKSFGIMEPVIEVPSGP